jgi:3-oxoacyl-[acyl-carrier-protein] synthase-3
MDLPIASAGSLFGMALAAHLAPAYGNVLAIGSEVMSRVVARHPVHRDTATLLGHGAGACLVSSQTGFAEIRDSLHARRQISAERAQIGHNQARVSM